MPLMAFGKKISKQLADRAIEAWREMSFRIIGINEHRNNQPLAQLLRAQAIGAGVLGFNTRAGLIGIVSPTACHHCDVFSELCSSGSKSRSLVPPLVTRFGV